MTDRNLVADAVASALGLKSSGQTPSPARIARALAEKRILLVLDNCEHVIDLAAVIAETIASVSPGSRV